MADVGALSAPEVRARIGHPMIDGDGHLIEVRGALVRFVHERGEERLLDDPSARGLLVPGLEHLRFPPTEERRRLYTHKANRWFTPARTRDYAAVTMPALRYEGLEVDPGCRAPLLSTPEEGVEALEHAVSLGPTSRT
jgi:hypothetical protein